MRLGAWLSGLVILAAARGAAADVDFARAMALLGHRLPSALLRPGAPRVALLAERTGAGDPPPFSVPIRDGWFALDVPAGEASALGAYPGFRLHWSPPRRLLLDRADGWVRASSVRNATGLTGRGVVVGIVDSGVDVVHPDLRNADGTTRVRWFIDFGRPARNRHPELEAQYGCIDVSECAIYSASDLNELLTNAVNGDEPRDSFGHGTHVASLAAGNGLSSVPPVYVGVAPEADLIVARVVQGFGGIEDTDILRAARFVFEQAEALGEPAVLNLSLGSDFGAHDGSSPLESALSSFVGPDEPGHAIVVAAGNSASLYTGDTGYPEPLGVHTEVHLPRYSPTRVPLLTLGGAPNIQGSVFVWLGFRRGDEVSVGLDRNGEEWIPRLASGTGSSVTDGDLEATVLNGVRDTDEPVRRGEPSAVVVLQGSWSETTRFELSLGGHGTAAIWVQGSGDLDPSLAAGALLPFAFKEGTVNIPASAPDLIAVGATLNRTDWIDFTGQLVSQPEHGSLDQAPPDTTAFFSSAGPNALGVLKPDIVAPGANVVGAMSALADPRRSNGGGIFAAFGRCDDGGECYVVDDYHAVSSGTSMASPIVAGAVALLFERDPTLTQEGVRALLQAGARPLEGEVFVEQQLGPGALDLEGVLAAQIAESSPVLRVPSQHSWLALADGYAHPDPAWPLVALLELRDEQGLIADGFDARRLGVGVRGGSLSEALLRVAPGLYRFSVVAPENGGGGSIDITIKFDETVLVERSVPIAVDRGAATGLVTLRGGCEFSSSGGTGVFAPLAASGLLLLVRRRRLRAARSRP